MGVKRRGVNTYLVLDRPPSALTKATEDLLRVTGALYLKVDAPEDVFFESKAAVDGCVQYAKMLGTFVRSLLSERVEVGHHE